MDLYPDHIAFHPVKCWYDTARRNHILKLDNLIPLLLSLVQA